MAHLSDLHWVLLCLRSSFVGTFYFFEVPLDDVRAIVS